MGAPQGISITAGPLLCPSRHLVVLPIQRLEHETWDGVAWRLGRKEEGRWLGRPRWLGSIRSWARVPPYDSQELLSLSMPRGPPSLQCTSSWHGGKFPRGQEGGSKGGNGKSWSHQTSPRPGFFPFGRTMRMRQEEELTNTSRPFSTPRPPSTPQRSSLLPSHYSLSPPGSSSMETPVYSPLGYRPGASSPWAWPPGLSFLCNLGPMGVSPDRCWGAGQESGEARPSPQGPGGRGGGATNLSSYSGPSRRPVLGAGQQGPKFYTCQLVRV